MGHHRACGISVIGLTPERTDPVCNWQCRFDGSSLLKKLLRDLILVVPAFVPLSLSAQISLGAGHYSQNFDSLAGSGAASWVDNATLPGWYASKSTTPNTLSNYVAG